MSQINVINNPTRNSNIHIYQVYIYTYIYRQSNEVQNVGNARKVKKDFDKVQEMERTSENHSWMVLRTTKGREGPGQKRSSSDL